MARLSTLSPLPPDALVVFDATGRYHFLGKEATLPVLATCPCAAPCPRAAGAHPRRTHLWRSTEAGTTPCPERRAPHF